MEGERVKVRMEGAGPRGIDVELDITQVFAFVEDLSDRSDRSAKQVVITLPSVVDLGGETTALANGRIHMLPPNLEYHRVPGRGTVIVLDRPASDCAVGDHLVVEERGTWQVRGIECTRVGGTGAAGKTCGLLVDGYPNKEDC